MRTPQNKTSSNQPELLQSQQLELLRNFVHYYTDTAVGRQESSKKKKRTRRRVAAEDPAQAAKTSETGTSFYFFTDFFKYALAYVYSSSYTTVDSGYYSVETDTTTRCIQLSLVDHALHPPPINV